MSSWAAIQKHSARRPYKLPSEKAHANIPSGSTESVHEEIVSGNAMKDVETALVVSEAHLFDMDSDDLDDVPPARLVKKVTAPDVVPEKFANHVLSDHSQESSSSEGVFVPTSGLRQTSFVEPRPSLYSSPIQSPISNIAAPSDPHAAPPVASSVPKGGLKLKVKKPLLIMSTVLSLLLLVIIMMKFLLLILSIQVLNKKLHQFLHN
ncbi:envelope-like protein [Cucumis melo var. makuwa]|uniref:Envelope-like protein n=2 Tax=Cucumis melo TaxID=3656 RepID=A0A5D3C1Y1_CUCMM|nr:envelope-like protein [Cucumis melo var. makuwa]TYK04426.1 envelope-like protein [Cucumis melo var. makuwa]